MSLLRCLISANLMRFTAALLALMAFCPAAGADQFGSGENAFEIEFVTIGKPGNPADTTGDPNRAGSVAYVYRIGKYEISEEMINKANAITEDDGDPLGITLDGRGPNKPATRVSWFEAARFVNWLNMNTGNAPAYKFDENEDFQLWTPGDVGYDPNNLFRNREARYFLPSVDEWYKAAFYDPATGVYYDFPNGSDTAPTPVASGADPNTAVFDQPVEQGPADVMLAGGPSPFGTVGQAGNIWEWDETEIDLINDDPQAIRGLRGSDWGLISGDPTGLSSSFRNYSLPSPSIGDLGFRVASVPEPTTSLLGALGLCAFFLLRRSDNRPSSRLHCQAKVFAFHVTSQISTS